MSKRHEWAVVIYATELGGSRRYVVRGSEGLCRSVVERLAARGLCAMAVREGGAA